MKTGVRRDSFVIQPENISLKPATQKNTGNTVLPSDGSFIGSRQNNFSQFLLFLPPHTIEFLIPVAAHLLGFQFRIPMGA
jgi:hypothetical protein